MITVKAKTSVFLYIWLGNMVEINTMTLKKN